MSRNQNVINWLRKTNPSRNWSRILDASRDFFDNFYETWTVDNNSNINIYPALVNMGFWSWIRFDFSNLVGPTSIRIGRSNLNLLALFCEAKPSLEYSIINLFPFTTLSLYLLPIFTKFKYGLGRFD